MREEESHGSDSVEPEIPTGQLSRMYAAIEEMADVVAVKVALRAEESRSVSRRLVSRLVGWKNGRRAGVKSPGYKLRVGESVTGKREISPIDYRDEKQKKKKAND